MREALKRRRSFYHRSGAEDRKGAADKSEDTDKGNKKKKGGAVVVGCPNDVFQFIVAEKMGQKINFINDLMRCFLFLRHFFTSFLFS